MITLIFRMKIREGKEQEALARLEKMATAVAENEPGALAYVFHTSHENPNEVVLYESYEDDAAFQAHMKTPHMDELRASVSELFDTSEFEATRLERVAGVTRG
jgi:quinol monooxygenase YgiN